MGYRVRMEVVLQAIHEVAETEKGKPLMNFQPVVGISAVLAYEVIVTCEDLRKGEPRKDLYALARQAAYERPIPFPWKRAYQLIAMAYYRIIKRFVRDRRIELERLRAERSAEIAGRQQKQTAA